MPQLQHDMYHALMGSDLRQEWHKIIPPPSFEVLLEFESSDGSDGEVSPGKGSRVSLNI